jgi:hypothetical protein
MKKKMEHHEKEHEMKMKMKKHMKNKMPSMKHSKEDLNTAHTHMKKHGG